jgi:MoxR-like ATPase
MATDWEFIERVLGDKSTRVVFIGGLPGTGKTYTAMRSGLGKDQNVYSVTMTPETPASELRGFWMPKGSEFVWQDGVFVKAMREGARVVINEIAHASHDVLAFLYPVLEGRDTAAITLPNAETVIPTTGFQVICTDNVEFEYLPDAIKDRFDSKLQVDTPHPAAIARLDDKFREAAKRSFALDEERRTSIRGWLKVQEFEKTLGMQDAFRAVFGSEQGHHLYTATVLAADEEESESDDAGDEKESEKDW